MATVEVLLVTDDDETSEGSATSFLPSLHIVLAYLLTTQEEERSISTTSFEITSNDNGKPYPRNLLNLLISKQSLFGKDEKMRNQLLDLWTIMIEKKHPQSKDEMDRIPRALLFQTLVDKSEEEENEINSTLN